MEIMPSAATMMDLGEILYATPYLWIPKRNDTNELIYQIETNSQTYRINLIVAGGEG